MRDKVLGYGVLFCIIFCVLSFVSCAKSKKNDEATTQQVTEVVTEVPVEVTTEIREEPSTYVDESSVFVEDTSACEGDYDYIMEPSEESNGLKIYVYSDKDQKIPLSLYSDPEKALDNALVFCNGDTSAVRCLVKGADISLLKLQCFGEEEKDYTEDLIQTADIYTVQFSVYKHDLEMITVDCNLGTFYAAFKTEYAN